jgi:hypothetical protein
MTTLALLSTVVTTFVFFAAGLVLWRRRTRLRPLSREERARYLETWRRLQTRFTDDPARSVDDADRLATEILTARGCPRVDFDRRVGHLAGHDPRIVRTYRDGHAIAERQARTELERKRA